MQKLFGIQYLRGLAALAVVVFHAAERTGGHFAIGAAGVDVFFVVSGFIMWTISQNRPVTPAQFLRDRLERIAPVYWIATVAMVVGAAVGLFPNLQLSLGHVLGSLVFIPVRSPSTGDVWPVLVQGWTLNYEMFFYVVFAGALLLPARRRLAALTAVLVGLATLGLIFESRNPLLVTYTNPIILEFLLGALIGKLWLDERIADPTTGLGLILVAALGFSFVGFTDAGFTPLVFGPLAAALVVGTLALERGGLIDGWRPAAYIGDASYSIYLWHTFAISVVAKLATALSLSVWIALPLAVLGGVAIGIAGYELLEKPIARALKRRERTKPFPLPKLQDWQALRNLRRLLRLRWIRLRENV
ncbi:acyltransferase family protein [Pseudaminobacter soli (ex Li et al. 2025)]|uniref:Acyltransferase n=1 Tax=Pseudaminobacter soli (ex Li et al. 2025) TaxID=1295366 RepID=A0A2P7SGJ2_9HYPH|nr:acyltransferase [Mesorhizobium soli]PSJ61616.1 acyltransferase [Mesorhizobium soli]